MREQIQGFKVNKKISMYVPVERYSRKEKRRGEGKAR